MNILKKVTPFILRTTNEKKEILLINHPYAGWQFPAGSVKPGEKVEDAAISEAEEETGLSGFEIITNY